MTRDPNLSKIELIASALGPLRDRLVFVGGCAVGLLITDNAAAPARVTFDVDLVASVSALAAYHGIEADGYAVLASGLNNQIGLRQVSPGKRA